jgi:tellurite resistance protein
MGEVSADLAAAACTEKAKSGRSALYKIAAGGLDRYVTISSVADLSQLKQIQSILEDHSKLFEAHSSHPASVVRMAVLSLLEDYRLGGIQSPETIERLHSSAHRLLKQSFPAPSDKDNWLTVIAAFWVAYADEDFVLRERREVAKLCSDEEFKEMYALCNKQESPSVFLSEHFKEALETNKLPACKKAMLLEKVILVARADGTISDDEKDVIFKICHHLNLEPIFAEHLLKNSS